MASRRIKFVFGPRKQFDAHWRFGLIGHYTREAGKHSQAIAISLRGLGAWLGALAVVGYFVGVTALFYWFDTSPYNQRTWLDVATWPVRRAHMAQLRGRALIAEGQDDLRAKRWDSGMFRIRNGLALAQDRNARLTLAQLYVLQNDGQHALVFLREGLDDEYPGRGYLEKTFDLAERTENFGMVEEIANRYTAKPDLPAAERVWLRVRSVRALMMDQRYDRALALLDPATLAASAVAREERVMSLLGLKKPDEALAYLAEWEKLTGADRAQVLRLRIRTLRDAGRPQEMVAALKEFRALTPAEAPAYIYTAIQCAMAKQDEAAQAAMRDLVFRFGNQPEVLQAVASAAAEIGNLPLIEQAIVAARERGHPQRPLLTSLVNAQLMTGQWTAAQATLQKLKAIPDPLSANEQAWVDWMQRLIAAAIQTTEITQTELLEFLRARVFTVQVFHTSIDTLRRANRLQTAAEVLNIARRAYPGSDWLKTNHDAISSELAAQTPAAPVSIATVIGPQPEKLFMRRLDQTIAAGQWTEVRRMISEIRSTQPTPSWLMTRTPDLALAEMKATRALGETPALLAASRIYLDGSVSRADTVLGFARELHQAGQETESMALLSMVLKSSPDYGAAKSLYKDWTAQKK